MNALTILERCKRGEGELTRMMEEIERLREIAEGAGVARIDVTCIGGSGAYYADKLLDMMGNITVKENELEQRKQALALERLCVMQLCEGLTKTKADVAYAIFIKGKTMKETAVELSYTRGYMAHIKREIKEEFETINVDDFFPEWYKEKYGFDDVADWRAAQ